MAAQRISPGFIMHEEVPLTKSWAMLIERSLQMVSVGCMDKPNRMLLIVILVLGEMANQSKSLDDCRIIRWRGSGAPNSPLSFLNLVDGLAELNLHQTSFLC